MNNEKKFIIQSDVKRRMIQVLLTYLIQAALLFLSAGSLTWLFAWLLQIEYFAILFLNRFLFLKNRPELIAERGKPKQGVKKWDTIITTAILPFNLAALVIIGLDRRFAWSPKFPLTIQIIGLILIAAGQLLFSWSMASNPFFSTLVRIQNERGHTTAQQGPYRYIRHPGYLGYMAFTFASPLALSSNLGFIPAGIVVGLLVIRTYLEDKTLHAELDGYGQYASQTKYRLIPGIW